MAIPTYEDIMLPLLNLLSDKKLRSWKEALEYISKHFNLTEEEKYRLLPSGSEPYINNRVRWAKMYLKKARLLDDPQKGHWIITERGLKLLNDKPKEINAKSLEQFPEYLEFKSIKKEQSSDKKDDLSDIDETKTPDELMDRGYNSIKANLGQELLDMLRKNSPNFFEKVVLTLLNNIGYGKGEVTGHSGDGGVDGFINQDKLGLDRIYFQAKRFNENTSVSASMLRDFLGALELKGANKGVFITTSKFPKGSEENLSSTVKNIVLIDGNKLVDLMMEYGVGVQKEKTYEIKKIDIDFFTEE